MAGHKVEEDTGLSRFLDTFVSLFASPLAARLSSRETRPISEVWRDERMLELTGPVLSEIFSLDRRRIGM